ncbi:MAG: amidohydrolase [Anaerolineales bacterium]
MTAFALINAQVYTMDPGHPHASGLLIQNGVIDHILAKDESPPAPYSKKIIDLGGKIILPGLIDSHLHLRNYSETLQQIDCETHTKRECLDRIQEKARNALELSGITRETQDPPGGQLGRDEDGSLTGILFENAVKLIETHIPSPSSEDNAQAILSAQERLWRLGLTGVHDFDRLPCLEALQLLESQGKLELRVVKSVPAAYLSEALDQGLQTGEGSDWLWFGGVKDFMDGALGPQTAAMLAPYQGTQQKGMLLITEDEVFELGCRAAEGGLALSVHAIGDLANRTLLNAYQRLREYELDQGIAPLPHRIEHLQLIDPLDIPRLAALQVTASMQPIHATSDMEMADAYWGERCQYAYAPIYPLEQGARVIFGSDAPVEDPNPWLGIHAAVTRRRKDGEPGTQGWHPEGRLSLKQALTAFTSSAAEAAGRGDSQGKLAPGFWADLIVLEQDPYQLPPEELAEVQPKGTMVNGKWVWLDFD